MHPILSLKSSVVDDNEDDSEGGDESQNEEEMPCNEENYAPNVQHDPMVVGSTYANMETFKLAISQHAIKNQFEFNTANSAPNRFRAYCSRRNKDNCPYGGYLLLPLRTTELLW